MFTTGQLIFAVTFAMVFVVIMIYSYKRDIKLHSKYYKGVRWVGLTFATFIIILLAIKHFLKN